MSAKNSAEAEPARKRTVWYFAASSGPAMSAYVLQARTKGVMVNDHHRHQGDRASRNLGGGRRVGTSMDLLLEVLVEAELSGTLDGVADESGHPSLHQATHAALPERD